MKNYIFLILICGLLIACNSESSEFRENEIVLKIADLEITNYEYKINLNRSGINNYDNNEILEWKNKYLDQCFIVADAYNLQYDTIKSIQKEVNEVSKFMVVQQYGYLWKKIVSPIVDRKKKITNEYLEKRGNLYYFDYIFCYDIDKLLSITAFDTVQLKVEDYNKLKSLCHQYDFLKTGYVSYQWPFISYWKYREQLWNMNEGEISKLLNSEDTYVYLYLDHIEKIEVDDNQKRLLQNEIQLGYEKEFDDSITHEMMLKGKPVINEENIEILTQFINEGNSLYNYKNNFEVIRYQLDNALISIDFKAFLESVKYQPFKINFLNTEILTQYLYQYYYNDYLNAEAIRHGIYEVDTFLLAQNNFKNNIFYREYIENEIINSITVDSFEILSFYKNHQTDFAQPRAITTDLYIFNSEAHARLNVRTISGLLRNNQWKQAKDSSIVKGLQEVKTAYIIDIENIEGYSEEFLEIILSLEVNNLSTMPILFMDKYVLIYKTAQEGQYIPKLEQVYSEISDKIASKKIETKMEERVNELKNKYIIEIDKTGDIINYFLDKK